MFLTHAAAVTLCLALSAAGQAGAEQQNEVYQGLVQQGLALPGGVLHKFPKATLSAGMTADQQKAALEDMLRQAGSDPKLLPSFFQRSVSGPTLFKRDNRSIKDAAGTIVGRTVDFYFVAHGPLDIVAEKNLMGNLFKAERPKEGDLNEARLLKDEELNARNLKVEVTPQRKLRYSCVDVPVMEEIQLSGIFQQCEINLQNEILVALKMDPRFDNDPAFPNSWRSVKRPQANKPLVIDPVRHTYSAVAGYLKATKLDPSLAKHPDGILIEGHLVYGETKEMFGGRDKIGPKLPTLLGDNAREFRQELKKAAQEAAAGTSTAPGK
jgi:hypothetical protein